MSEENFNMGEYICKNQSENIAIISNNNSKGRKEVTFKELNSTSNKVANLLKNIGISKGDRVLVFMEKNIKLYFITLGIIKTGAIYCPVFSSFGTKSLDQRISDCTPTIIVTQKSLLKKARDLKQKYTFLNEILVVNDDNKEEKLKNGEISFDNELKKTSNEYNNYTTTENDIAAIYYTSGTTAKPKGVVHTHKGVKRYLYTFNEVFNASNDNNYWCTADHAWITGSIYGIFAPLLKGVTIILDDNNFISSENVYSILEKNNINIWYTAPTYLRMLMRQKTKKSQKYDLSKLNKIYSVGEALTKDIIKWGEEVFDVSIRDTWFQTETGSIMIANYNNMKIKYGSMGKPLPDIEVDILDQNNKVLSTGETGKLAIRSGWDSMFINYWNSPQKYNNSFVKDWYITGDLAMEDEDGYFWYVSREDDIINVAGHLVSPIEIEKTIREYYNINKVAAKGIEDEVMGERIGLYIELKDDIKKNNKSKNDIKRFLRKKISAYAVPKKIKFVDNIPKTKSGKIARNKLN